jgi:SAM-dependent methyltransferase
MRRALGGGPGCLYRLMAARQRPDREEAIAKYRADARGYDRRTGLLDRYRRQAVERLGLAPGATVIDVACGTGANFGALERRIGARGQIIGIDLSPEMLELARQRVERHSWQNVTLVEAAVDEAELDEGADARCSRSPTTFCSRPQRSTMCSRTCARGARWSPSVASRLRAC